MAPNFEAHRELLYELFLNQDMDLPKIMAQMEREHDFKASKTQYCNQFIRWNWRKYMTNNEWHFVWNALVGCDDTAFEKSVVMFQGRTLPQKKVRKELSRRIPATVMSRRITYDCSSVTDVQVHISPSKEPTVDSITHSSNSVILKTPCRRKRSPKRGETISSASLLGRASHGSSESSKNSKRLPTKRSPRTVSEKGLPYSQFLNYIRTMNLGDILRVRAKNELFNLSPFLCPRQLSKICSFDFQIESGSYEEYEPPQLYYSFEYDTWVAGEFTRPIFYQPFAILLINDIYYSALQDSLDRFQYIEASVSALRAVMPDHLLDVFDEKIEMLLGPPDHSAASVIIETAAFLFSNGHLYGGGSSMLGWMINTLPWGTLRVLLSGNLPTIRILAVRVLEFLVSQCQVDLFKDLLELNPKLTNYLSTRCLSTALEGNMLDVVELWLKFQDRSEARLSTRLSRYDSLVYHACSVEAVKLFVKAGASLDTAIADSIYWSRGGVQRCKSVQYFIDAGADVNGTGEYGTHLIAALSMSRCRIAQTLINAGAVVTATSGSKKIDSMTSLILATVNNSVEVVKMLLQRGAGTEIEAVGCFNERLRDHFEHIRHITCTATALQFAASSGNVEIAELLIDAGANVNAPSHGPDGITALQAAVEGGKYEMVEFLLRRGAQVNVPGNSTTENCRYALLSAIEQSSIMLVRLLLDFGADPNFHRPHGYGSMCLEAAVYQSDAKELTYLLRKYGANGSIEFDPASLQAKHRMCLAVEQDSLESVQGLLAMGVEFGLIEPILPAYARGLISTKLHTSFIRLVFADFGVKESEKLNELTNESAMTMIHLAVMQQKISEKVFRYLVNNTEGQKPLDYSCFAVWPVLFEAIARGRRDLVEILLNAGADIEITWQREGCILTALKIALFYQDYEMIDFLVSKGAKFDGPGAQSYPSLLESALYNLYGRPSQKRIIFANGLLDGRAGVEGSQPLHCNKPRPLHRALRLPERQVFRSSYLELIHRLFNAKVDANAYSEDYKFPLMVAVETGDLEVVLMLLDRGANVNARWRRGPHTALCCAAKYGFLGIAKVLIERGPNVDIFFELREIFSDPWTPLMCAARYGKLDMVKLLIDAGADAHLPPSERFKGAEMSAWPFGHLVLADFLRTCRNEAIEEWNQIRIQEVQDDIIFPESSHQSEEQTNDEENEERRGKRQRVQ